MKVLRIFILLSLLLISCSEKTRNNKDVVSVDKAEIPSIEKNSNDENFVLKNGILYHIEKPYSGIVKELYSNKKTKTVSEYYNGKREGIFLGYYNNGNKWFERFYSKGIKIGTHKGWFENGQLMFEYQLNNKGMYNGSVKDWHFNGQLAKHFNFKNGKEFGSQKMWKLSGKIRANFYTVNGERHGLIGLKNCVTVATKEKDNL